MRHFFAARPVATLSSRVAASPRLTILVALSGTLDCAAPGLLSAVFGTINLATVATAADQSLSATAGAKKQPSLRRRCGRNRDRRMDDRHDCRILPLQSCPARCRARRRSGTAKLRSAPCLPLESSKLLRATRAGSQPVADPRNSNIISASAARLRPLCSPGPTLAIATRPASGAG